MTTSVRIIKLVVFGLLMRFADSKKNKEYLQNSFKEVKDICQIIGSLQTLKSLNTGGTERDKCDFHIGR